jgi:hypothetical protein
VYKIDGGKPWLYVCYTVEGLIMYDLSSAQPATTQKAFVPLATRSTGQENCYF